MTAGKTVIAGVFVAIVVYVVASNTDKIFRSDSGTATIGATVVAPSLAPSAKNMPLGAKKSGTNLAPSATGLAPSAKPAVTSVAPIIPRIITVVSSSQPLIASVLPSTTVIPRVSAVPTPTPTPSPTPISLTPDPTPSPTPTPTPTPPAGSPRVVINEIAWAGTVASQYGEWFELYNAGDSDIDLTDWGLYKLKTDGTMIKVISLTGKIVAGDYFLVERYTASSPDPIDIQADIQGNPAGKFGDSGLSNTYEHLGLLDSSKAIVDETALCLNSQGNPKWCGGLAAPSYSTMERLNPFGVGSDPANWATWGTVPDAQGNVNSTGLDAADNPIRGTPKFKNSVTP